MSKPTEDLPKLKLNGRVYGILLALSTLLTVIVLAHHPVSGDHSSSEANRLVHSGLIALILLTCTGMSGFAWRLGIEHPAVMAGWIAYLLGTMFLITAGLINGFITSDAPEFKALLWALNQTFARTGLVLLGFGLVMWGHALLHHRGIARPIAVLAMAIGGVSAVYVLTKSGTIDLPALFFVMTGHVVWNLTVAFWMILGLKRPISPA